LSIYIETNSNVEKTKSADSYNENTYDLNVGEKKKKNVYFNKKQDFKFIETFFGDALKIREDSLSYNWKFIDSTKIIGKFKCKLANKRFRGRNYFVWYTEEIPTNFGPWKINNLGGLVIEAYDDTESFSIIALKINYSKNSENIRKIINETVKLFENEDEVLSVSELKIYLNEKNEMVLNRINELLPRGSARAEVDNDCEECESDSLENY
jgi:GLPGLI family protein